MNQANFDRERAVKMLTVMERIRAFEENAVLAAERHKLVLGAIHPSFGQEAAGAHESRGEAGGSEVGATWQSLEHWGHASRADHVRAVGQGIAPLHENQAVSVSVFVCVFVPRSVCHAHARTLARTHPTC